MADIEDVNDDEAKDSSTSANPDVNEATESSTDASAADEGSQSAESDSEADVVLTKEQLIAQLRGTKTKDTAADDESEVVEPEEEDADEATKAPAEETEDDGDIPDEEINAPLGKDGTRGARERIQNLLKQRKAREQEIAELKPTAEFGRNLLTVASEAKMAPEQLGAWIVLAAEINKDPKAAPARLMAEAKRIAAQVGVTIPREVDTLVPKEIDEIEEMLIADALEGNVPADVVKKYREKLRAARAGKQTAAQVQTPPPAPVQQQPALTPNIDPMQDPTVQSGLRDIGTVRTEFSKKHASNWAQIEAAVKARMGLYNGTHPTKWGQIYRQEIEAYVAKNTVPVKKAPSNNPLRSTTGTTSAKTPTTGKSAAMDILKGKK